MRAGFGRLEATAQSTRLSMAVWAGGSQKDRDGMKQGGSTHIANDPKNDPKKTTEAGNKGAVSK
jgi:hypothetical protein